jgi:hypothetical protein
MGASTAPAFPNLTEAYSAMGFNPSAPGNAVVVLFSDPHISLDTEQSFTTTNLDPRLVNNVNAMVPPPARILVSGDEISSYSTCPGQLPNWPQAKTCGTREMQLWLPAIQAFTNISQTNILWIPGNHDQDPRETNAELFCQMFPSMPPYQRFDLAGVSFFLLNGGNMGFLSESEQQWLKQEVAYTSPTQTVAVVIHQPPYTVNRGNSIMLEECFRDWPARWWTFCGHGHYFIQQVFDIGRSNVTMSCVGSVNTNTFNGQTSQPGFMVLCLSNGIAGRVYYHFKSGDFEVVGQPDWLHPTHFTRSFEEIPGLLWRRERVPPLGTTFPEVIKARFAYDAWYYYAYTSELQWALPLGRHGNQATHFLLSTHIDPTIATVSFSADLTNWIQVPPSGPTNSLYYYPIPGQIAGLATGYARFDGISGADNFVYGWGLATTNPPPYITFPTLAPVPDQSIMAGRILTITNLASDPYAPPDVLTFSLLSPPNGASVDPRSGVISFQPPITTAPGIATVTVKVADNGTVPICATQRFFVSVTRPVAPIITSPQRSGGQNRFTVSGDAGVGYTILASTNLNDWTPILNLYPPVLPFQIADPNSASFRCRFYRIALAPWVLWDADATNFLARAGIPLDASNTIPTAINFLARSAKAHGWWTNCDAIYPFVGGTSASHSLNLKCTNYSVLWKGSMTHDASGVIGDGSTGYGDTQLRPFGANWAFQRDSAHLFVYSGTYALPEYSSLLGCSAVDYSSWATLWSVAGVVGGALNEPSQTGLGMYSGDLRGPMVVSRTGPAMEFLALGKVVCRGVSKTRAIPQANVGVLAVIHDDGSVAHYCSANVRGATIGHGLTEEQWGVFRQDWDEFEEMLGRKVP